MPIFVWVNERDKVATKMKWFAVCFVVVVVVVVRSVGVSKISLSGGSEEVEILEAEKITMYRLIFLNDDPKKYYRILSSALIIIILIFVFS